MKEITSDINWNQLCWKYMKTDYFIDQLKNSYMYFASADEFDDPFERAIHVEEDLTHILKHPIFARIDSAFKALKQLTKISCWHKSDNESNLMWKFYAQDKKGIAIVTTAEKMKEAFKPYKIQPEYGEENLYIGNVQYIDLTNNNADFGDIKRFFYKHIVFQDEKELRLAISLSLASEFVAQIPEKGIQVPVDYEKLIDKIILGPNLPKEDKQELIKTITELGFESKISNSSLTYLPRYI